MIRLKDLRIGHMYKLHFDHEDWNNVVFKYIGLENQEYLIEVIEAPNKKRYVDIFVGDHHGIAAKSSLGVEGVFEFLGSKEENPEFFL